jgi:PAS domain S-box-containing protein
MSNVEGRRLSSVGVEPRDPLFEALLAGTSDAVFVLDEGGGLVQASPRALALLGYTAHELRQRRPTGVFAMDMVEIAAVPGGRPGHTGSYQSCRCLLPHKNGDTIPMTLAVHRGERAGRRVLLCIARDLPEPHGASSELPAYFAVAVSHELRTPLTTILGSAEVLLRSWARLDDATRRAGVERVLSGARRLDLLVRDLLLVVGIEDGELVVRPVHIPLVPLLEQALYEASVAHPNLNVRARGLRGAPTVRADPDRVVQVLVHLLDNAARHGRGAGPPELRVAPLTDAGQVRLSVSDRGPGLPLEGRERLFTRFGKLSSAAHAGRLGTGLGLYLCRRLVEAMGGAIGVESTPGKGASFWFTLPLAGDAHGHER